MSWLPGLVLGPSLLRQCFESALLDHHRVHHPPSSSPMHVVKPKDPDISKVEPSNDIRAANLARRIVGNEAPRRSRNEPGVVGSSSHVVPRARPHSLA